MKTVEGYLQKLGYATANNRTKVVNYSFLEIGERVMHKISTFHGLDGKLIHALGKTVTLHISGNMVVALTTAEGQTYCTQKIGTPALCSALALSIGGLALCVFIVGLPLLLNGLHQLNLIRKANAGAALPRAIQIPR